jgi:sulfatase modifying factor 1
MRNPIQWAVVFLLGCRAIAADTVLTIEKSEDGLRSWRPVVMTPGMINADGKLNAGALSNSNGFYRLRISVTAPGDTPAGMVLVQGGTLPQSSQIAGETVGSFFVGISEVTWDHWQEVEAYAVANGYDIAAAGAGLTGNHPATHVNWFDALKWCNAKSEKEGLTPVYTISGSVFKTGQTVPTVNWNANGYRLPSDAEWEWAARGGVASQGFTYSGSNTVGAVAWYSANSSSTSHPVMTKAANELGLYDASGNVFEWVWDEYSSGNRRVRGGTFYRAAAYAAVADRQATSWSWRLEDTGFRFVRAAGQ